ncbi:MAG: InlB B-repeat-containing protein [Lachnospiraceae bacterium]|nr:InlB B-repeat-containing protein [Lachnospiraceae bacterium]
MRKSLHRIIAFALSFVLVMSEFTVPAFATEAGGNSSEEVQTETGELSEETAETVADEKPVKTDDKEEESVEKKTEDDEDSVSIEVRDEDDEDVFMDENSGEDGEEVFEHGLGYNYIPGEGDIESIRSFDDGEGDSFFGTEDPLPERYVTPNLPPLRDQNPYDTCWAFGAMAGAEINMMKKGLKSDPDFSELHLSYFSYEKGANSADPLGGTAGDLNRAIYNSSGANYLKRGGNLFYATNVLASWIGAADETTAPYTQASPSKRLADNIAYKDAAHLENCYVTATEGDENIEAVKRLVMNCGSAQVAFLAIGQSSHWTKEGKTVYFDDVFDRNNVCYYFPLEDCGTNHIVTIVGWNDNFPKENFAYEEKPGGDGAWLIRNSWTTEGSIDNKSYDGYFWLSYYDKSLWCSPAWGFEYSDVEYDNNYQYDGAMNTLGMTAYQNYIYFANIFEAHGCEDGEIMKAVLFVTLRPELDYEVSVYKNPDPQDPTSGTLVASKTGKTVYQGTYTVPLDEPVELDYGDRFSVVVKQSSTKENAEVYAPVEHSQTSDWVKITASCKAGQSFISADGAEWDDVTSVGNAGTGNARVKALTCDVERYDVTLDANGGVFDSGNETETIKVKPGEAYGELPTPKADDFDFAGWFMEDGTPVTETSIVPVIGDHTLRANWTGKPVTVEFDANGGACETPSKEVHYSETYGELPVPGRENYDFAGWFTKAAGGNRVYDTTEVETSLTHTLYAHWTKTIYNITFNANGGCFDDDEDITIFIIKKEASSVITEEELDGIKKPTCPLKNFTGWYTDQGCSTGYVPGTPITESIVLYAGWQNAGTDEFVVKFPKGDSFTYTGSAIKPAKDDIEVYFNAFSPDRKLVENVDYTLAYKNNTNVADKGAGTAAPTITIKGKGNYENSKDVTFSIVAASIGDGTDFADDFTYTIADKQYNGSEQVSKPTVKYGKVTLREGADKDYTLSYEGDQKRPGTVTVTVTARTGGNFSGGAKVKYDIYEKNKNIGTAYVEIENPTYNGAVIPADALSVKVYEKKGGPEIPDTEYTVRYASGSNRKNAGTATLEIVGQHEHMGRKIATFKILQKDVSTCYVIVNDENTVYNGSAQKPSVEASFIRGTDKVTLTEGTDFTLSYTRNTNAGDETTLADNKAPTVTVKGKGNYKGSQTVKFTIKRRPVAENSITMTVPDIKSSKAIEEKNIRHTLKFNNPDTNKTVNLTNNKDYRISEFNYDDSQQLQTVKFELIGNYINDGEIDAQFLVYEQPVTKDDTIVVSADTTGIVYTGTAIKPEVSIKREIGESEYLTLVEGRDFKVTYSNNTKAANYYEGKKAPSWKATGMGAYSGELGSGTFTIARKSLNNREFEIQVPDVKLGAKPAEPKIKVINKATGKALAAADYDVAYSDNAAPKTDAKVTVTGKGNYTEQIESTFCIYREDISKATFVAIPDKVYTGGRIKPEDVAVYADKSKTQPLVKGVDYRLEYGENIKKGTGSVTVIGINTEWGGKKTLTFKIKSKAIQHQ